MTSDIPQILSTFKTIFQKSSSQFIYIPDGPDNLWPSLQSNTGKHHEEVAKYRHIYCQAASCTTGHSATLQRKKFWNREHTEFPSKKPCTFSAAAVTQASTKHQFVRNNWAPVLQLF